MKLTFKDYLFALIFWVLMFFAFTSEASPNYRNNQSKCRKAQERCHYYGFSKSEPMKVYRIKWDAPKQPLFYKTGKSIKKHLSC